FDDQPGALCRQRDRQAGAAVDVILPTVISRGRLLQRHRVGTVVTEEREILRPGAGAELISPGAGGTLAHDSHATILSIMDVVMRSVMPPRSAPALGGAPL